MKIKISAKNSVYVLVIVVGALLLSLFGVKSVYANCCGAPPNGVWWNGCCFAGGDDCCTTSQHWCSGGDEPCDHCICGNGIKEDDEDCEYNYQCDNDEFCNGDCECEEEEEQCELCTLSQCPNPPLSDTSSSYLLDDFYSCTDSSACPEPKTHYRDCYEVPSTQPSVSLQIKPESIPTSYGFTSTTYTGAGKLVGTIDDIVNEPINMVATYTDTTSAEIEAMYVWFKKGTAAPLTPIFIDLDYSSVGQSTRMKSNDSFGFLMVKRNGSWFPFVPGIQGDGNDAGDRWLNADPYFNRVFYITGTTGNFIASIKINSILPSGNSMVMDFNVSFNMEYAKVDDGAYNVFLMGNDTFGFTPYDNYTAYPDVDTRIKDLYGSEQIRLTTHWADRGDWGVDLTSPSISNYEVTVSDKTKLTFNWTVSDNIALYGLVGNLYIDENFEDVEAFYTTVSSGGTKTVTSPYTPHTIATTTKIGHLQNDFLFRVIGNYGSGSATIDVKNNRKGIIYLYLTGFDRGGNHTQSSYIEFDLRDWMATQGGLLFSRNGIDITSRVLANANLWDPVALINKFDPITADVSSELESDANVVGPIAPDKSDVIDSYMIRPYAPTDLESYYTILRNSFERKKSSLQLYQLNANISLLTGSLVTNGSSNIRYLDRIGSLTVGTPTIPFTCNGRGVFFVSGNLTINGKILNTTPNKDACIFVVKGNVIVREGANVSGLTQIQYDPLNAYILADGTFVIEKETDTKNTTDGLYVGGGIHTLDGLTLNRYLKLSDRLQFPAFVVDHHSKYGVFAGQIFGTQVNMQKVEVGIKP